MCQLRVLLQLIAVGRFELGNANIDTINFGSVVRAERREARATDENERTGNDRKDDQSRLASQVIANILQHICLLKLATGVDSKKNPGPPLEGPGISIYGGADGTRTRDPRRDRPVF